METTKPTLVIMAAGMGSRYGGLKQIAPVDDAGHIIMDYSIYDAYRAGFRDIVCIINPSLEKDFTEHFARSKTLPEIRFAHQQLDMLPQKYSIPQGREKPWGTAHAIYCAKNHIKGPFAVINADDFYGAASFTILYDFLEKKAGANRHAMVGYQVENTLTENGYVTRGVCEVSDNRLVNIQERAKIKSAEGGAAFTENEIDFVFLPAGTMVSMNMWGFGNEMFAELEARFETFLNENLDKNPLKCEYLLPAVVGDLLAEDKAQVEVFPTTEKWYGITYADDMPRVRDAIRQMIKTGKYPENF